MNILRPILVFVEICSSFLLIGIILLQKTKKEGLGLAFGAGIGESLFGSRAGNILTKTTVVLAVVFLLNTTILSISQTGAARRSVVDEHPGGPAPAATQTPPPATGPQGMPPIPDAGELPADAGMPMPGAAPMPGPDAMGQPEIDLTTPVDIGPSETRPGAVPQPAPVETRTEAPSTPPAETAPAEAPAE